MSDFVIFFDSNTTLPKRLLWENMIYQALFLLEEAGRRVRSPEGQARYAVLDGWWRPTSQKLGGKQSYKIPEETAISQALAEEMRGIKEEAILESVDSSIELMNIDTLEVACEVPRKHKKGIGRKAKPTDFQFYRAGQKGLDLRVEAKVLTKKGDIGGQYLSGKGLGRFSDPHEPYTDEIVGGMIAYTINDDRKTWVSRIQMEMNAVVPTIKNFEHTLPQEGEDRLFCCVPFKLSKSPPQSEVLVFHVVLEFDSVPSAR